MTHTTLRFAAATFLCMTVAAQQHVTVPASAAARDGVGVGWVPGFERVGREQFLIGQSLLAAAVGQELNAITFRRDGFEPALAPGQADLSIWLSVSSLSDVREASPGFAANRGSASLVFQGRVNLPSSPRLANRHAATWATPNAVTLAFTQPWRYTGGHLCVAGPAQRAVRNPLRPAGEPFLRRDEEPSRPPRGRENEADLDRKHKRTDSRRATGP